MRHRAAAFLTSVALLALGLSATAQAAPDSRAGGTTPARRSQGMTAAANPRARVAAAAGHQGSAARTLEDIHIEGEIPVPQVLFVTARDQRRFTQFHHRRYLKTSLEVGAETPLPSRVAIGRSAPAPSQQ